MFLYLLYWLLAPILWVLLPVASLFNPKIRHHWLTEKRSCKSAEEKINEIGSNKSVVLFHAASSGEFEQLQPILKQVDREQFFILQSFFSPTAFNLEKDTNLADSVCYHPFDFPWSAVIFFCRMKIQYYITTRNDLWPTHLYIAKNMEIQTVLINANLYRESHYKSWIFATFYREILGHFDLILTGSTRLKNNLLNLVPENKVRITGDSRFDRVISRKDKNTEPLLPETFRESRNIILGSIVRSDYPALFEGLKQYYPNGGISLEKKNQRLIIAPHEIKQQDLNSLETELLKAGFQWTYFTEQNQLNNSRVVIINKVGILADLYIYSDLAYVGAGFGSGVHSVLEPAVYANAISFGPHFHILDMAVSLADMRLAMVIQSEDDFFRFLSLLDNDEKLDGIQQGVQDYMAKQNLASDAIIDAIFSDD